MALTKVQRILPTKEIVDIAEYALEPIEALIAAHEQFDKLNHNTWTYKTLTEYEIKYTRYGAVLGTMYVQFKRVKPKKKGE